MIGLEAMGMSMEDVFISIVDKTDSDARLGRAKGRRGRTGIDMEKDLAASIVNATAEAQKSIAPYDGED